MACWPRRGNGNGKRREVNRQRHQEAHKRRYVAAERLQDEGERDGRRRACPGRALDTPGAPAMATRPREEDGESEGVSNGSRDHYTGSGNAGEGL